MEPRRRISVSKVLMALAVIAPLGTIAFWWLGSLPDHYHPVIGRTIFANVPDLIVALFYVGIGLFIGLTLYLFALRARNWERGGADKRTGQWMGRAKELWRGLSMTSVLEERAAGIMHSLIYYGFVLLLIGTITLEIDHLLPGNLKFLEGGFYQVYSLDPRRRRTRPDHRCRVGSGAAVDRQALAYPRQDQVRGRLDPPGAGPHRCHRPRHRSGPDRRGRTARLRDCGRLPGTTSPTSSRPARLPVPIR